jgi:FkbM family methyltransferase
MEYHCFEADRDEYNRLKDHSTPYKDYRVFPYLVGKESKNITFNLYKNRRHSSIYKPGKRYYSVFSQETEPIEKSITLPSKSLTNIYNDENLKYPDFTKLDTQGSELDILMSSQPIIDNTCLIEVEVEFTEIYHGQPLFHDVMKFMTENGFELLYINRVFDHRRKIFSGKSRGQITWGDALFGRKEDNLHGFSDEQITKYILLLLNYGHVDFAYQLTNNFPQVIEILPTLNSISFRKYRQSKFKRFIPSQIDKLVLLWFYLRKYNQMDFDNDRNWPYR